MIKHEKDLYACADEQGHLVLPPELVSNYGIRPGRRFLLRQNANNFEILPFAGKLNKLYIEVTNQCNLDCRTCVRHAWNEPLGKMGKETFNLILEALPLFSPVPSVFIGGFGEPLLHPEIINMITALKKLGASVELITNGTLLTEKMSRGLIQAGLDVLWVSLDGARPESYTDVRLGAALPEVLGNLEKLNGLRFSYDSRTSLRLGVVFVAMKRNIADLPAVADIARRLSFNYFLVTNVLPYTREMLNEVLYFETLNSSYIRKTVTDFPVVLDRSINNEMFPGEYSQPVLSVNLPRMDMNEITRGPCSNLMVPGISLNIGGSSPRQMNNRCPFIENGAGVIDWDGSLSPCLPLMHSYDMYLESHERHSRRWIIGNIKERSLSELWNDPEHLDFRERVQAFDFPPCTLCGGCELIENNEKDCFGNPFPTCGGCLWAQGFVQCP